MKTVRIAAGAGYAGNRIAPALDNIARGNVDYIIFECLAERTMVYMFSVLAKLGLTLAITMILLFR